jgi:hypothetical protein
MGVMLSGCGGGQTPECAEARREFAEALPSLTGFHPAAGDVVPAIVAGIALAVVEPMPDEGQREQCYNEIMRGRFLDYPPYAAVR